MAALALSPAERKLLEELNRLGVRYLDDFGAPLGVPA